MFVVAERFFASDTEPSAWVAKLVVKTGKRGPATRRVVLGPRDMAWTCTLRDAESIAAYLNGQQRGLPRYTVEPCDKHGGAH